MPFLLILETINYPTDCFGLFYPIFIKFRTFLTTEAMTNDLKDKYLLS
jgi:hypothetical protein